MDPQHEWLDERLAQSMGAPAPGEQLSAGHQAEATPGNQDTQIEELVTLSHRLQAAPQLHVNAGFAETLERRFLRHALLAQHRNARHGMLWHFWRRHNVAVPISFSLLLLLLLGLGWLVLAVQTATPANPLDGFKRWMQPGQTTSAPPATPTPDQATLELQRARWSLATLLTLTAPAQDTAYIQELAQFDVQLTRATKTINALSSRTEKTQMSAQLALLKNDAREKLRGLLHTLTSTASSATTTELGRLGEPIPQVHRASIALPAHPRGNATITIVGNGIQSGAQLLVDGKLTQASGTLQNGQIVFVLTWPSEKHPHSLGIINPDGTVAQTTTVTVTTTKGGGNGNGKEKGSGECPCPGASH